LYDRGVCILTMYWRDLDRSGPFMVVRRNISCGE
jgi:hypothetical protein